jgi:lysophospholipase
MFRRGVLLALVLSLAACGDRQAHAPFTDSRLPSGLSPKDWPPHGWAWGLIRVGDAPAQRYGVAAAPTVPRAQVLILPGYGDFAETHFAEASALIDHGDTVWILDGAGQGGSGRAVEPRDVGHVAAFDEDQRGLEAIVDQVMRPPGDAPFVIVAEGTAAPVALHALQLGRMRASGLILIDPVLKTPGAPNLDQAGWASRLGLGAIRAPGERAWVRDDQLKNPDQQRRMAWQTANPDLRMGGPSLGWQAAFADLIGAMDAAGWSKATAPVLLLTSTPASAEENRLCRALPHCTLQGLGAAPTRPDAEAAFIQGRAGPDALPPWTRPLPSDEDRSGAMFDVPR